MDSASMESFAEVEILGIYMSAAAAAGVWILKAIGDHASKKKKQQNSTRENLITRMLWNYSPAGGRYPESFYSLSACIASRVKPNIGFPCADKSLSVCLFSLPLPPYLSLALSLRSTVTTLTAWWRLVLVGLLIVGLFPMFLSPILGKEESVVTAIGAISIWILYLLWYALKHVILEGSGPTPSGRKDQKKRLNVTIVTGFLVSCAHATRPLDTRPCSRFIPTGDETSPLSRARSSVRVAFFPRLGDAFKVNPSRRMHHPFSLPFWLTLAAGVRQDDAGEQHSEQ